MRRGSSKGPWTLFLFLMAGLIIGSLIVKVLYMYFPYTIFDEMIQIGTKGEPAWLDLLILQLKLGLTFSINVGTVLGVILGIFFYYKA